MNNLMPDFVSLILTVVIAAVTLMIGLAVSSTLMDTAPSVYLNSTGTIPDETPFVFSLLPLLMIVGIAIFVVIMFMSSSDQDDITHDVPQVSPSQETGQHASNSYQSYFNQMQSQYVDDHTTSTPVISPTAPWNSLEKPRKEKPHSRWEELEI